MHKQGDQMDHTPKKLTLADAICYLRQMMIDASQQDNRQRLSELLVTFSLLREASYNSEDKQIVEILVDLEDAARDLGTGMGFMSKVPSVETIRSALSSDPK
jgi:hypothetical protein